MAWLALASSTSPGRRLDLRYSTTSLRILAIEHGCASRTGGIGQRGAARPGGNNQVGHAGGQGAGFAVGLLTGCAQFQHIAKQRNPPPAGARCSAGQHIQRRAHAVRAGVVAIFQEG